MKILDSLNWRYATKKFNPHKKVSEQNIETLKDVIRLSASSYGLQLYKVLIVTNENVKKRLKPASMFQNQITDASHLFIFCIYDRYDEVLIDENIKLKSDVQSIPIADLSQFSSHMKETLSSKPDFLPWAAKQTYIALGNLLTACGEIEIDSCPIEGFEPGMYDEILELKKRNLKSCVIAAVGYRSDDDFYQFKKKVRRANADIFEEI